MHNHKHPSSAYARILFRHLRLSEKNSQAYFAGTAVTYDELMSLDGTIPRHDLIRIYRNALAISDREDIGLSVGAQFQLSAHGPLGVATFNSADLLSGLNLLAKFGQTRTDFFNISVNEHIAGVQVEFTETFDLGDLRVFVTEATLSGFFSAITFFTGHKIFSGEIRLVYPKPNYGEQYYNHFGENVKFNQPATVIIVPASLLSMPSPTADPALHQEAIAICERQLKEMNTGGALNTNRSTEEAVSTLIRENPGKIWTLKQVAEKLSMSSRTLIRKLASEGTQFQKVGDELAKSQAVDYLADRRLSVESVGYLMGFSDVSSFRRSFKRWFGETPSQYLARTRGDPSHVPKKNA